MAASMTPKKRKRSSRPTPAFTLPTHWSPSQALAVFDCMELLRDQLWIAYGPQIQRAWRAQLNREHPPPNLDPDSPF
jgi:hypothetical protein